MYGRECKEAKIKARNSLKVLKRFKNTHNRKQYCEVRKRYKSVCRHWKREYQREKAKRLYEVKGNSKLFWRELCTVSRERKSTNSISKRQWFDHFYSMFNVETDNISKQ